MLLRFTSEHLIMDVGGRGLLRTMDLVEAVVRGQLDPARLQVESLASLMQEPDFKETDSERVKRLFEGALASTPQIRVLIFCDSQMNVVYAQQAVGGGNIELEALDGRNEEAYKELDRAMREADQKSQWGEPVNAKLLDRTLLNVRYPVRRDGQYIGTVVAGVTTREMSRVLENIKQNMGTSTFLMLSEHRIIAHPSLAKRNRSKVTDTLSQQIDSRNPRNDIHISRPAQEADTTDVNPFGYGKAEAFEFKMNGQQYIGFRRSLDDYGDPPLAIGTYFKARLVGAPMELMYTVVLIGLFVLAAAIGLAALISRTLTASIRRVSIGVTKIGQFNIADVEEMRASRILEVNDLAMSFNRMLSALRSFSTYVPHKLANLVVQGEMSDSISSEERVLTVMFTDIVGFTSQSEGLRAPEVANFINEHLTLLASCVEETGGTIDKYIGDSLMAFWGAPQYMENPAEAACRAAQLMEQRIHTDNQGRVEIGKMPIHVRIGIHSGPLVVGNIGAPGRINYTVVGDTVNVAQRLESLGKQIDPDTEVIALLSSQTAQHVSSEFKFLDQGSFQLPGKKQETAVERLIFPGNSSQVVEN